MGNDLEEKAVGDKLRAKVAGKIVDTLGNGVKEAWASLSEEQKVLYIADTLDPDYEL